MTIKQSYFISGTDTDVGKTLVSAAILKACADKSYSTLGMKPVAAGCEQIENGLRNGDALLLQKFSTVAIPYQQINPIALEPAIAPHIAAEQINKRMSVDQMVGYARGVLAQDADICLIEGAGGWYVPVNESETLADLPKQLDLPVILVVSIKLGCINHALLSARAIANDGLKIAGWVANLCAEGIPNIEENIASIAERLQAPLLGTVPYIDASDEEGMAKEEARVSIAAKNLAIDKLF